MVEHDLLAFAGPRGTRLLPRRRTGWRRALDSACPAALLFSFAWFYWRRLPALGGLILLPAVLGQWAGAPMPGIYASFVLHVLGAASGRSLYRQAARRRARRADALGLHGAAREGYLRDAGGTSLLAGSLAGALWLMSAGAMLAGLLTAWRVR